MRRHSARTGDAAGVSRGVTATCPSGKRVHASLAEATEALAKVQRKRWKEPTLVSERRAYRCDLCEGWHLTKIGPGR